MPSPGICSWYVTHIDSTATTAYGSPSVDGLRIERLRGLTATGKRNTKDVEEKLSHLQARHNELARSYETLSLSMPL
jgi:hypothetical protein